MEDLHELGAAIPCHLQVARVDEEPNKTYQQQAVCLDILINYTMILSYRLLTDFTAENLEADPVTQSRQQSCRNASYAAAQGICCMVADGRDSILDVPVQLLLSTWGVYTSAAEVIALSALSASAGTCEVQESYESLGALLRHFSQLQDLCQSTGKEFSILRDLVRRVRAKIYAESRRPSPESGNSDATATAAALTDASFFNQTLDLQWFDRFLDISQNTGVTDAPGGPASSSGLNEYNEFLNFAAPTDIWSKKSSYI